MATNYPNGYDSLTNPTGTDALSSPAHASQHADANDAIEAIQATLGLNPEGAYANVDARLDALVTDAAAAASSYADASSASAGSALASAGSAAAAAGTAYSYQQGAETNANQAAVSAGSAYTSMLAAAASEASASIFAAAAADALATFALGLPQGQFRYTGFAWYDGDAASPDSYQALDVLGRDAGALTGNTGYTRQTTGVPVDPQVQSRLRRCVLKNDGTAVAYYLDCDDSTKIAGLYTGGVQTGWVRVHEGVNDPVRPIPGQATSGNASLRSGIPTWSATAVYAKGDRVLSGGSLWDCLNDGNTNITPASGTVSAVLDGTDGQVMVEIPRFYYAETYDPIAGRMTMAVACDTAQFKPFPTLSSASSAATSITVGGRTYAVHPAFTKAGVQRDARYIAAYRATATDTGNNGTGTLKSTADGSTVYAGTISRTNFRLKARNNNSGLSDPSGSANDVWALVDYYLWHAVQVLFLTEYRTFYAQSVLGGGNQYGADYQKIAGRSNPLGNASGSYNSSGVLQTPAAGTDFDGVAYRGIEDLFGSQWLWIDGWNINHDTTGGLHYISNTPAQFADNTTTNYAAIGGYTPFSGWLYAKTFHPGTLIPAKVGGSTTTYSTDGFYGSTSGAGWRAALVGGHAADGANDGLVALVVYYSASAASANIGAALAR